MTDRMWAQLTPEDALEAKSAALASSLNAIALAGLDGSLIYVNPAFLAMWQYTEDAVVGHPATEFWQYPERAASVIEALRQQGQWQGELVARRADGSSFDVRLLASLVSGSGGHPICMMGVFLDVTDYKRTEEALRRNSWELNERVKELNVLYRISALADDPELTIPEFLKTTVSILPLGWQYPDNLCARITLQGWVFSSEDFQESPWQQRRSIYVFGKEAGDLVVGYGSLPSDMQAPSTGGEDDGGLFLVEERHLLDELTRRIGRFVERKQAEADLSKSEARYRELFESSPIALFEQDFSAVKRRIDSLRAQGVTDFPAFFESHPEVVAECISLINVLALNRSGLELYGATSKEDLLIRLDPLIPEDGHRLFSDELALIAEGRTSFVKEGVNRTLSGDLIYIRLHWMPEPGCEDCLDRVLVSVEDITAERQAQAALQVSEERYRAVSELTSDFAFSMRVQPNGELRTEWVTDAFRRITGFDQPEIVLKGGWIELLHPDDRSQAMQGLQAVLAGRTETLELRLQTKSGATRWIRFYGRPGHDPETQDVIRVLGAGQDVTDLKRLEQEMIRTERLAAMGQMTATLAHEIKNPLQAIQSNLELLSDYPLEPDERSECLQICKQEVQRLREITQNVLDLSRPRPESLQPISVADLCTKTLELLNKPLRSAAVAVTVDLPPNLPAVLGVPEQVTQVILNLVLNAVESMPNGGSLRIQGRHSRDRLVVTLINDGPPIPAEHLDHIFDPFFTTKPGGTGLGLFVCHTIVQQHGGLLAVSNEPGGCGVRFTLTLPVSAGDQESAWSAQHRADENQLPD